MTERLLQSSTDLADRLVAIRFEVQQQCIKYNRNPNQVTLMGVSKKIPAEIVNQAYQLGVTSIGENRVQEFLSKKDSYSFGKEQLQFIGHLQTKKVKQIIPYVNMIQSLDSLKLASEIDKIAAKENIKVKCLLEINISKEPDKTGISPDKVEEFLYNMGNFTSISLEGLMTIGENTSESVKKERIFNQMHSIFIDMRDKKIDNVNMHVLSMGMSSDYLVAIKHGSTIIRLGTALFGARNY